MAFDYDLFVIGAGSGGVRASRIAAGYGARVGICEDYRVGGTCVIRGCVPKKLLVYGAHFAEDLKDARRFGWQVPSDCEFDWKCLQENVLAEVDRINKAYTQTIENSGAEIILQRATVSGPNEVTLADGSKKTAEKITVREPVPASRNEQIVVKMLTPVEKDIGTPELKKEIIREANGGLAWEFTLQPGGKRDITLKFSIEHPADVVVSGLE